MKPEILGKFAEMFAEDWGHPGAFSGPQLQGQCRHASDTARLKEIFALRTACPKPCGAVDILRDADMRAVSRRRTCRC